MIDYSAIIINIIIYIAIVFIITYSTASYSCSAFIN